MTGGSIAGTVDVGGGSLTGTGAVSSLIVGGGGAFIPGNGTPGSSMPVTGNLMLASGWLYVVQIDSAPSSLAMLAGSAVLGGATVNVNNLGSSYVSKHTRSSVQQAA